MRQRVRRVMTAALVAVALCGSASVVPAAASALRPHAIARAADPSASGVAPCPKPVGVRVTLVLVKVADHDLIGAVQAVTAPDDSLLCILCSIYDEDDLEYYFFGCAACKKPGNPQA